MILETITIIIYSTALILIFMYALAQLNLLFNYLSAQKKQDTSPNEPINLLLCLEPKA